MATYQITAPSGKTYEITGPPNASREDLIRQIRAQEHRDSQLGGKDYQYKSEDPSFLRKVGDIGTQIITGTERALGSTVGLGSYVWGLNKLADPIANWLHNRADMVDEAWLSARQKELNREISTRLQNVVESLPEDASLDDYYQGMLEGGGEAGDFLWNNKAQVLNLIAQSVPYMVGGGLIAKGVKGTAKGLGFKKVAEMGPIVGAGIGEGLIVGGDLVTQHIAETDSVGEYDADRLKLLGAVPTTAGIAMAGGRIAKGLKVADPDVAITGKIAYGKDLLSNKHMAGGLVRRTGLGVAIESGEEFLQEGTEQMWGNVAAGRHPLVGVGGPAVMGAAAGGGQSGGINLLGAAADIRSKKDAQKKLNTGIDESLDEVRQQKEQQDQEQFVEAKEQQDLFNQNEDILREVLNLVGIDNLNIAENIPGVDPEVVNNLESPLDQAVYYLQALKKAPQQIFESDDGRNKTNTDNLIATFEQHIEALAPGVLAAEEEADLIQAENESRRKHAGTYPNEREWEKIVASEEFERLRIEISDRNTELGKLFTEWQDATDIEIKGMHDTDANGLPTESAVKLFIKDHPDLFPKGTTGTYVEALTEHARLEENRLTRSQIDKNYLAEEIAKLVARRTQALADGNLQELRTIEEEVARRQSPIFSAEWLEAKRAITAKPKKKAAETEKVEAEVVATGDIEQDVLAMNRADFVQLYPDSEALWDEKHPEQQEEPEQLELGEQEKAEPKPSPYKEGSKVDARHKRAVEEFGENYADEWFGPKVKKAIERGNDKKHPNRFENFLEFQAFKIEQWKIAEALEGSEMKALGQIPLKGTWQQAVIPFLVDAANRDRLFDYGEYKSGVPKTAKTIEEEETKRVRGINYELDEKSLTDVERKKLNFVSKAKKPPTLSDIIESINKKRKAEKRPLLGPKTKFTVNELVTLEEKTEGGKEKKGRSFVFYNQIIAEELNALGITGTEELTERDAGRRINDALAAYRKNQKKFGESEQKEKALYDKLAPKGKETAALRKENERRKAAGDPPLVSRHFRELIETFFERTEQKIKDEKAGDADVSKIEPDTGAKPAVTQVEDEDVDLKGEIDAAEELARIATAGASQAKIDALTDEEKEYVAEKANRADPEYLKRVAASKKASIERVKKANSNKKFLKELKTEWTKQNKGDASKGETVYLPYDQQPIEVQEAWIWSVNKANSQRDRRPFLLAREFKDTVQSHRDTIKKLGDEKYEETDSIPEIEIAELAEEKRKARERESRPGTPYYKKSAADIEQALSKELKKVGRKKLTDRQRANAIKKLKARPIVQKKGDRYINIPLALRRHLESLNKESLFQEGNKQLWEYSTSELVLQAKIAIVNMENDTLDPKTWKKLKGSDLNKFNSLKNFITTWQEKKGGDAPDDSDFRLNVTDIHAIDEFLETLQSTPADFEDMFHKLIGRRYYKKLYDQGKIAYYKTAAEAVKDINKGRSNPVEKDRFDDAGAFVSTKADGTLNKIAFILNHIRKEDAASVFFHEVAGHIGLEGILGPKGAAVLAREIRGWARGIPPVGSTAYKRTSMSKEKLAAKALDRVERHKRAAIRHGTPLTQEDINNETIAYFVQGAVEAGVKPTDVTAAGKILKRFRDAFLKFMQLARLAKQGNYKSSEKPNITAQNIVDMAWGAAKLELRPSLGHIWKTFRSGSRYLGTTTAQNLIHKAYHEDLVDPVRFEATKHDPTEMEDPVDPRSKKRRKLEEELRKLQAIKPSNMTQTKLERKLQLEDEFRLMNYLWERHRVAEGSRAKIDALNKEIWALDAKKRERRASSKKTFSEMTAKTWEEKIEDKIRREVPKNDKGKYIAESGAYLAREDWIQFQKDQWAKEKRLRTKYKEQVIKMLKDAAQHEEDMGGPDGTTIRESILDKDDRERSRKEADKSDKHVEENFNADMKGMWTTMKDIAKKGGRKLEFLHEQIYRNRKAMPGGVEFGEGILKGEQLRNEIKKTADSIAVQARNLSSARLYVVNQTIAFGTLEQLWPADPATKDVSVAKGNVTIDKEFQKVFEEKLSKEEQKIVMDVYRHGIDLLAEKRIRTEATLGEDASALFRISEMKGPYAPLRRTGSHTVVLKSKEYLAAEEKMDDIKKVKSKTKRKDIEKKFNKLRGNKNHYVYTHFLTAGEATKFADKEEKTGNWAPRVRNAKETGIRYQEKPPAIGAGREPDIKVLQKVYGALSTSELKDDPDTKRMVEAMLKDLFIESLEETNARQSMARREGIHGYDENMLRSFVTNAKSEANLIANLAHGKEINVALSKAYKEAHAHDDENTIKLYRELVFHYNLMLNQKETNFQDAVASFTTAWVLTMSPTYHLQNATQPWAVSYPILAAVFNDWAGVTPRMLEGYKIARSIISYDGKVPFLSMKKVTWQTNVDVDNVPTWVDAKGISKEERARRLDMWVKTIKPLLQRLQGGNLLDLGIEQDLSDNVNMKTTGVGMYDATTKFAGKASHRLYQVPRMVEAYNRVATAIAAHEMAQANPKVMEQLETTPEDFAVRVVRRTQGDFTASGAPGAIKWLLNKFPGKLFAQFQKFRFLMIANYVYAYRDAFHGATAVEKAVGRRALTYLIAHTTVLSGVRGLPFIGGGVGGFSLVHVYFWLMSALPFLGGEPEDEEILTEGLLERKIMESFPDNPEFAKAITRGLPYLLGIDTSMKLSHAGIFDPTPFTEWELSTQGFYELGYTIFGASGSNALNIGRGAEFMKEGNYYRGVESMMPKGIRSVMESGRLATEGYSLRGGEPVASPDNFSTKALLLNALGIPTSEVVNLKWTRSEQFQITEYFTKAQTQLRNDYAKASKARDKKKMGEIKDEWLVLQKRKDGLRPFFNNAPSALKRTPLTSLWRAQLQKEKTARQYSQELGTVR